METMAIAIGAIFLMFFANFMVLFARKRKGWLGRLISFLAFLLLIPIGLMILIVLFT